MIKRATERSGNRTQDLPLVSVIIPSYNYAHYITQAIDSVLDQTYPNIEIIVVDDGSTDETSALLRRYGDRIRYLHQANAGLPAARNAGIAAASGAFIQFLDSDDLLDRHNISSKVGPMLNNSELAWTCSSNSYFFDNRGFLYTFLQNLLHGWPLPRQKEVTSTFFYHNIAPPHAYLVRRRALTEHQLLFDTDLKACEDYDFWLKILLLEEEPILVPDAKVLYRRHPGSMSMNSSNQLRHDAIMAGRALQALCTGPLPATARKQECLVANFAGVLKAYSRCHDGGESGSLVELEKIYLRLIKEIESTEMTGQLATTAYLCHLRKYAGKLKKQGLLLEQSGFAQLERILDTRCLTLRWLRDNGMGRATGINLIKFLRSDIEWLFSR